MAEALISAITRLPVDQFHLFLTFIGDDGDDLEARVGFDVYRRVDRPFSDAGDAPGKLIARGELQAAILGGQGDPRRFNQRDGFFTGSQTQRLLAAMGDDRHQFCATGEGQFYFIVDRAGGNWR